MNRSIRHIVTSDNGNVLALCEDGTMWCMNLNYRERGWWQLPAIPEGAK